MDTNEIKKLLRNLSVKFVYENNTVLDRYTYEDLLGEIYMASRRRHIIGDLQLFEANGIEGYTEAVFMFSPNYLNREIEMMSCGMDDLRWKLLLPDAVERENIDCDDYDWEEIEKEIIEKITNSKVEIINYNEVSKFSLNTFKESISRE